MKKVILISLATCSALAFGLIADSVHRVKSTQLNGRIGNKRYATTARTNKFSRQKSAAKSAKIIDPITAHREQLESDLKAVSAAIKARRQGSRKYEIPSIQYGAIQKPADIRANLNGRKAQQRMSIRWNRHNDTPAFIEFTRNGKMRERREFAAENVTGSALDFLQSSGDLLRLENPAEELVQIDECRDALGFTHKRYQQYYKGIKVWASDLYLHLDAKNELLSMNGRYHPTPDMPMEPVFTLTDDEVAARAADVLGVDPERLVVFTTDKIIYIDADSEPRSAWIVEAGSTRFDDYCVFIDAATGEVLSFYNNVKTGTPVKGSGVDLFGTMRELELYQIEGLYYMVNTQKNMFDGNHSDTINDMQGIMLIADARNVEVDKFESYYFVRADNPNEWPANAVTLAHYFATVYDYYRIVHGRTTLDDKQHNIVGIVNMGQNYSNAYWSGGGKYFCFGNGDGDAFTDWAGAFDLVAHEYSHGVTQYSSNLEYQFQSGALNEGFSDFIGVMAEFWADPDHADWLICEDAIPASSGYTCLRDLSNPHNPKSRTSDYPDKMSEFYDWPIEQDNGGVHRNSTIPGHAFYLMSTLMSRDKVEKIIYRAYIHYLTRRSQFVDLRLAAIQAAKDLYPDSDVTSQVGWAFDRVEIYDGEKTEPTPKQEPVSGDQFVLCVLDGTGEILSVKAEMPFQEGNDFGHIISTWNKPSITEDGSLVVYVDWDGNVNLYDIASRTNEVVTDDGSWHSVALSPLADYVAMVPDPELLPAVIGIADIDNDQTYIRQLYIPTTGLGTEALAYYADIMDWSIDGGWLLYDCSYTISDEYGYESEIWGVYLTNAQQDAIISVFQPDITLSVGNPSFSSTRDNIIAFDVMDFSEDWYYPEYYLYTYDLFEGGFGFIAQNFNAFGHPSFSPDDSKVVFQDESEYAVPYLVQVRMRDILNAEPDSEQEWIEPVRFPVWYATGSRPRTAVDRDDSAETVYGHRLSIGNYPNPFNPVTNLHYTIPETGHVKLMIYDILGKEIARLVDANLEAGEYQVTWNGADRSSGIYLYRLETETGILVKKMMLVK